MEKPRVLDPQIVALAEEARSHNKLSLARKLSGEALGIKDVPITPAELTAITSDSRQLAVLACLSRIHVDSLKTLANLEIRPWMVFSRLQEAFGTIQNIYYHPDVYTRLRGVTLDHQGRSHHFLREMARDEAKAVEAAAVLYPPSKAEALLGRAEIVLGNALFLEPLGHGTDDLISLEMGIKSIRRGYKPDGGNMLRYLDSLVKSDLPDNPHRLATIASQIAVWGDKALYGELVERAEGLYSEIVGENPGLNYILRNEQRKRVWQALRNRMLVVSSHPVSWVLPSLSEFYRTLTEELVHIERKNVSKKGNGPKVAATMIARDH